MPIPSGAVVAGRAARGLLATSALGVAGCAAFLLLTWSCCSSPPLLQRLGNPFVWCAFAALPVALAALPFLSRRLRLLPAPLRWLLAPCALAALLLSGGIVLFLGGEDAWLGLGTALPTAICAVYVLARVVPGGRA